MKKIFMMLLTVTICFFLSACGGDNETSNKNKQSIYDDNSQQEANSIDISKLEGTWKAPLGWDDYFVFDGNGCVTRYTEQNDGTFRISKYEYKYFEKTGKGIYVQPGEGGVYLSCPVEIIYENDNVQCKIFSRVCEKVDEFTPNITN